MPPGPFGHEAAPGEGLPSDPFGPPSPYGGHREGTAPQGWPGDGPGDDTEPPDPYRGLWRPDPAYPGPSGSPVGPGPASEGHGPSEYETSPGSGYFGGADPFRSVGAGSSDLSTPERTSAFDAPPLSPEGPGMYPPPPGSSPLSGGLPGGGLPGDGPPGASQMGQYPDDFPMDEYRRPPGYPERGRRTSRKALIIGLSAAAAVIVAAGAAYALTQHAPAPPSAKPSQAPAPTPTDNISSVQTDPKPITGKEIFPHGKVTEDGLRFVRVAQVANKKCGLAARGSFARALKAGGCERVVRATYVDSHKRYAVTTGVAALPTSAAAQSVDHKENFKTGAWFTGLNGKHGTGAQNLSHAAGYAYDLVEGRYIVYAFSTDANGKPLSGSAAQNKLLNSLSRSFALMARQPIDARGGQG
jgi:hypothetical protein